MSSWSCCGCWSTGDDGSAKSTSPKICQLHQLLLELVPGGAKKDLSAAQARKILAGIRPRDEVRKLRKRVALELVLDPERTYLRKKLPKGVLTQKEPEPDVPAGVQAIDDHPATHIDG
jgi:hypothetical protein